MGVFANIDLNLNNRQLRRTSNMVHQNHAQRENRPFTLWMFVFLLACTLPLKIGAQDSTHINIRGAWLTTLNNIDWPSKKGLDETQLRKELFDILDFYESVGINTIFFQVRPEGDAFYRSSFEPWSEHITGNKGQCPPGNIDPLQLLLDEAHNRYMEVHAWINPFRALFSPSREELEEYLEVQRHPDWFVKYGKNLYFDPGVPEVRAYTLEIIKDIVTNYDVDGIHFDDYFYPYPVANLPFLDSKAFELYGAGQQLADWRKANIDDFVFKVHQYLEANHPYIKFGISPFGVWENNNVNPLGSATKASITSLSSNHADVISWAKKGWVDYLLPQIYWNIGFEVADFEVLTKWWNQHNYGRHLYVGHSLYKFDENAKIPAWRDGHQIIDQLNEVENNENILGSVFFNTSALRKNVVNCTNNIRAYFRNHPAKIAVMPYKKQLPPTPIHDIKCHKADEGILISWRIKEQPNTNFGYAIYVAEREEEKHLLRVVGKTKDAILIPAELFKEETKYEIYVSAISRTHQEEFYKSPLKIRKRKGQMLCR